MLTSLSPGISTAQTILFRIWKSMPTHPSRVAMIAARDKKGVSFSSLELLIPMGSTNAFLLFNDLISFCFNLPWADRNISLYTVFPWFCFHFYRMQIFIPLGSLAVSPRAGLLIAIKNSKWPPCRCKVVGLFVFISHISLVNFCHMTCFSIKPSLVAIPLLELVHFLTKDHSSRR